MTIGNLISAELNINYNTIFEMVNIYKLNYNMKSIV